MNNRSTFGAANRNSQQRARDMMSKHADQYVAAHERKFREVKIAYKSGWWRNKPDEAAIMATIQQYKRNGWQYVERK